MIKLFDNSGCRVVVINKNTMHVKVLPLTVAGYGIKLCDHKRCRPNNCTNVRNSKYYVDERDIPNLANKCKGTNIVVNHQNELVIGKVTSAVYVEQKGLFIEGYLDDHYFLTYMHKVYDTYRTAKGNGVNFLDYLKGLFPSFSLSSRGAEFEHVSLVITPGRKGTNVSYKLLQCAEIPLSIRQDNINISENVLAFVSVYLPEPDRKYYLSCSQDSSVDPKNFAFLRASREPVRDMDEQQQPPPPPDDSVVLPNQVQEQQQHNVVVEAPHFVTTEPLENQQEPKCDYRIPSGAEQKQERENQLSCGQTVQCREQPTENQQYGNIDPEKYKQFLEFLERQKQMDTLSVQQNEAAYSAQPVSHATPTAPKHGNFVIMGHNPTEQVMSNRDDRRQESIDVSGLNVVDNRNYSSGSSSGRKHAMDDDVVDTSGSKRQRTDANEHSFAEAMRLKEDMNNLMSTVKEMSSMMNSIQNSMRPNMDVNSNWMQQQNRQQVQQLPSAQQQQTNNYRPSIYRNEMNMEEDTVRFENDVLNRPRQQTQYRMTGPRRPNELSSYLNAGTNSSQMIQANREPQGVDENTINNLFIKDVLDRMDLLDSKMYC